MRGLLSLLDVHESTQGDEGADWPGDAATLLAAFRPSQACLPLDPLHNACIDWQAPEDIWADSYSTAATILVNWTVQTRACQDLLVYPVLFLFRHYVELQLKQMLSLASAVRRMQCRPAKTHSLATLWEWAKTDLRPVLGTDDSAWRYMGRCIRELEGVDPTSQSFRYGTDAKGDDIVLRQPDSREAISHINLGALARVMVTMQTFLDGTCTVLRETLQARAEMR